MNPDTTAQLRNRRYREKNLESVRKRGAEWQRKWRAENPELAREKDRLNREAKKARGYKQPPYKRSKDAKAEARIKLNNAVKLGKVKKQSYCSSCLDEGRMEGHHPDYSKPLEVIWLCSSCHGIEHHPIEALVDTASTLQKAVEGLRK